MRGEHEDNDRVLWFSSLFRAMLPRLPSCVFLLPIPGQNTKTTADLLPPGCSGVQGRGFPMIVVVNNGMTL
jgi:hypothetical protein